MKIYKSKTSILIVIISVFVIVLFKSKISNKQNQKKQHSVLKLETQKDINSMIIGDWTILQEDLKIEDGYRFLENGKLEFINMYSWTADGWHIRNNDSLVIYHHTERYPEIDSSVFKITSLTDSSLTIIQSFATESSTLTYRKKK